MRTSFSVLPSLIALATSASAFANDGIASKKANGIQFEKSDSIAMLQETLTVSPDEIRVKYVFKNESPDAITTLVAFPIPEFDCSYFGDKRTSTDFTAKVNGKRVKTELEEKAFFRSDTSSAKFKEGEEVTAVLKRNKIPIDCRKLPPLKAGEKISNSTLKKIEKLGLGSFPEDDPWDIRWNSKLTYHWKQTFPGGKEVSIEHTYKPVLGMNVGVHPEHEALLKKNDPNWTSRSSTRWVDYILKTARTWKGPIREFKLRVLLTGNDFGAVTNLGKLEKIDARTLELTKKEFSPAEDLLVLFESRI